MRCPICADEVEKIHPREKHLIITKDCQDGHIHVHGELSEKSLMKEMIESATTETNINLQTHTLDKKEIVFHNRQRIGDILMFTCGVRDFKRAFPGVRINILSTCQHIWDHNPYIDRTIIPTSENIIKIGPGLLTNASNRIDWHFANAYRVSIEQALGVHIPQGESRPDIWLTKEEYDAPRTFEQPYWLIVTSGEPGWGCKMYPFQRWQEFINQNQDILFVQLGAQENNPPRLQGKNVIDYVGKTQDGETGIRDLFKLFLNAEGSISLVSFPMHLSAAFYKPAIIIAGAREPVSFTRYPGHQYLATDGCLPCAITACWHCDINVCSNLIIENESKVPKCVDMIYPEDLTKALNNYYRGGRLKKGEVSEKPKLKNIVSTPDIITVPEIPKIDISKYGMAWGGGCITERDWEFMQYVFKKYNIKTVLEFGTGLSTLLMNEIGLKVITYETNEGWVNKIHTLNDKIDIRLWDGKELGTTDRFDFAFVDGPAGGKSRELSTKIASEIADIVIIHDANREYERKWQDKYIKAKFDGPSKGGHRCHLWTRKAIIEGENSPKTGLVGTSGKFIKVVSTARGWGGCARSTTTIMDRLLKAGHKVEFIPFRNKVSSHEFLDWIKTQPNLKVTENYDTLKEPCDILFVYADDYVWEFGKNEIIEHFTGLNANRKIMMLNYRRGKVGELTWTKGWDKYMFLNSFQEKELLKVLPEVKTKVLPPCTELEEFFKIQPVYNNNIRIVRHSSQGDVKFSKNFKEELDAVLNIRTDVEINMMPGPTFIETNERFKKFNRNNPSIPEFLSLGNLFWYSLPPGYMDQGPRVILEAMASGLPVIADNWGGTTDRVTKECGWLCDTKEQMKEIIKNVTFEELQKKGQAARERARNEFIPEKWISEIIS